MGDNGKELNQTLQPEQPENKQPGFSIAGTPMENPDNKVVMTIYVDKQGVAHVYGMIHERQICLNLLGDVIKIIANHQPSPIVQPPRPGIVSFLRGGRGKVG